MRAPVFFESLDDVTREHGRHDAELEGLGLLMARSLRIVGAAQPTTSAPSKAAAAGVTVMPEMTVAGTFTGGLLVCFFSAYLGLTTLGDNTELTPYVDGAVPDQTYGQATRGMEQARAGAYHTLGGVHMQPISAGRHQVDLMWFVGGVGSCANSFLRRSLIVGEIG